MHQQYDQIMRMEYNVVKSLTFAYIEYMKQFGDSIADAVGKVT